MKEATDQWLVRWAKEFEAIMSDVGDPEKGDCTYAVYDEALNVELEGLRDMVLCHVANLERR